MSLRNRGGRLANTVIASRLVPTHRSQSHLSYLACSSSRESFLSCLEVGYREWVKLKSPMLEIDTWSSKGSRMDDELGKKEKRVDRTEGKREEISTQDRKFSG